MQTKVSIITVCYNSEKTIERTIRSVLDQTYNNIEYVIIDGASKDHTMDIVKKYEPEFNGRMRYVSEPDGGIYYAMNKGIDMSSGELIGIINSDDWYEKDAVRIMCSRYDDVRSMHDDLVVLYGRLRSVDEDGKEVSIDMGSHKTLREDMIAHPTCFVSKKVYYTHRSFDTQYISAADYDLMLRLYESGDVFFEPVEELIANFTLGGMCAGSRAYYDLLKVRKNHHLISSLGYYTEVIKCRSYDMIQNLMYKKE